MFFRKQTQEPEMHVPAGQTVGKRSWLPYALALTVIVLLIVSFLFYRNYSTYAYIIPGVPYAGIHNHVGPYNQFRSDADGAVFALTEYWVPATVSATEVIEALDITEERVGTVRVEQFLEDTGKFSVTQETLSIQDLRRYLNEDVRTPLLTFLPIPASAEFSIGQNYRPLVVVVGVDYGARELIVHDHWLGGHYRMSFAEYSERQMLMPEEERSRFLVVHPLGFEETLAAVKQRNTGPADLYTPISGATVALMQWHALAMAAEYAEDHATSHRMFETIVNSDTFSEYPRPFAVWALNKVASSTLAAGEYERAKAYVDRQLLLNDEVSAPYGTGQQYEILASDGSVTDQISGPYRILGDLYTVRGETALAREAYLRAYEIEPGNPFIPREAVAEEELLLTGVDMNDIPRDFWSRGSF